MAWGASQHSAARGGNAREPVPCRARGCLLTATAQWRDRARGAWAVVICRHLYSSLLLVSSSYRSLNACALPAVNGAGWVGVRGQGCGGAVKRSSRAHGPRSRAVFTVQSPVPAKQQESATQGRECMSRALAGRLPRGHGLLPENALQRPAGGQRTALRRASKAARHASHHVASIRSWIAGLQGLSRRSHNKCTLSSHQALIMTTATTYQRINARLRLACGRDEGGQRWGRRGKPGPPCKRTPART